MISIIQEMSRRGKIGLGAGGAAGAGLGAAEGGFALRSFRNKNLAKTARDKRDEYYDKSTEKYDDDYKQAMRYGADAKNQEHASEYYDKLRPSSLAKKGYQKLIGTYDDSN